MNQEINEIKEKLNELTNKINDLAPFKGQKFVFKAPESESGIQVQGGVEKEGSLLSFTMIPTPTNTGAIKMQVMLLLIDNNNNLMTVPAEMCRPKT